MSPTTTPPPETPPPTADQWRAAAGQATEIVTMCTVIGSAVAEGAEGYAGSAQTFVLEKMQAIDRELRLTESLTGPIATGTPDPAEGAAADKRRTENPILYQFEIEPAEDTPIARGFHVLAHLVADLVPVGARRDLVLTRLRNALRAVIL